MINDYRRERVRIIREAIFNLTYFLTMDLTKLERIPIRNFQNLEKIILESLSTANQPQRYVSGTHISTNDIGNMTTDIRKNHFSSSEEFSKPTRAKDFKKFSRGDL